MSQILISCFQLFRGLGDGSSISIRWTDFLFITESILAMMPMFLTSRIPSLEFSDPILKKTARLRWCNSTREQIFPVNIMTHTHIYVCMCVCSNQEKGEGLSNSAHLSKKVIIKHRIAYMIKNVTPFLQWFLYLIQ
jgi:hypothetical protein